MKLAPSLFAVGYMNFMENDLKIEVISADSVKEAILKHSWLQDKDVHEWINGMPDSLEEMKEEFFNGDAAVDVVEVEVPE